MDHSVKHHKPKEGRKGKIPPAPRKIIGLPNPDKLKHETYEDYPSDFNIARFPVPFRCVILGKVNSGKSLIVKHILMARQEAKPKFKEVYIVHGCENSEEYDDVEPTEIMKEIPSYTDFDPDTLKLLIIDDFDFTMITREQLTRLSELFRFGSTHCNMSIILAHQSWFRIPKIIKDTANVFVIFRPHDLDELKTIGRRVGLSKDVIVNIFDSHLPNWRDSLCIDLNPKSPSKFRKNLFEPLNLE